MMALRALCFGGLAAATLTGAVSAASPETEAIATVLIASDLADICPEVVQRRGPRDREQFIIEGIRVLIGDGHRKPALYRVTEVVPPDEMYAVMDGLLAARGVNPKSLKEQCRFAGQVAGTKDRIGRFLEKAN